MRYLLVAYSEGPPPSAASAADDAEESAACERSLRDSGRLLILETLHPPETATTVRVRGGRILLADGPCSAETGRITGVCLIDARDYTEALRISTQLPAARLGRIEVRAVRAGPPPDLPPQ